MTIIQNGFALNWTISIITLKIIAKILQIRYKKIFHEFINTFLKDIYLPLALASNISNKQDNVYQKVPVIVSNKIHFFQHKLPQEKKLIIALYYFLSKISRSSENLTNYLCTPLVQSFTNTVNLHNGHRNDFLDLDTKYPNKPHKLHTDTEIRTVKITTSKIK